VIDLGGRGGRARAPARSGAVASSSLPHSSIASARPDPVTLPPRRGRGGGGGGGEVRQARVGGGGGGAASGASRVGRRKEMEREKTDMWGPLTE